MVSEWFVPVRISRVDSEDLFQKYQILWTPTMVIIGPDGREHVRFTGFLPPDELCARLVLDGAKAELNLQNFDMAEKCLQDVVEKYPNTFAVPEAIFYQGVAQFVQRHDPKVLRESFDRLKAQFPDSEWTLRAKPYELIDH